MKDEMFQQASKHVSRRSLLSAALAGTMLPWFGTRAALAEKAQATDSAGATRKSTASEAPTGTEMIKRIRRSDALLEVVVHNPPFNLVVPEMVSRLHDVVVDAEADADLKVVVFKSALPGYFINHFDLGQAAEFPVLPNAVATPTWTDLVLRLSRTPVIMIADIRGRTRGGGNEFALACDMRYAALGEAIFGQPEVGAGIVPGGGGTELLPRLIGRDRAMEAILSSQDYPADYAERVGWVTRAMRAKDLDGFIDELILRLAGFDKQAIAEAKAQINRATLPPDADVRAAYGEYKASLKWPGFEARRPRMRALIQAHGAEEVERRLGHYLGQVN